MHHLVTVGCVLIGLFALYQVFFPLAQGNQVSLILFLAAVLPLTLLCYRSGVRLRRRKTETPSEAPRQSPTLFDWLLAAAALVACLYPVLPFQIGDGGGGFNEFLSRQSTPAVVDVVVGTIVVLLVLEACRRTTGAALPIVCLLALGYAYYGGYLPQGAAIAHAGVDWVQIVSASFMQSTGLYGVPLDVAATYIVLFTIYGAVLEASGASKFFIDLSFSAFRSSRAAPGRTVTLAGFLMGSVSGSGTATTVSLGSVTWPVLRRAGYPSENAGGMLAAAGIGAILSPPTLGAAAFIIAEYLGVPYLTVLVWAVVPTILYYLGILLAVEIDARRYGTREVDVDAQSFWRLLGRFGYHLISLVMIVVFLAMDVSAMRAVVYAIAVQIVLSYLDREHRLTPVRLYRALATGVRGVLSVAAVCAAAGVVAAMITRTGLGLQLNSILVNTARFISENPTVVLIFTAIFAALAVSVLGLAVPVTASFVISWVIVGSCAAGPRRRRARGGDVRLLFRSALRSHAADGAGVGRGLGDHRRTGDSHDDADVEVHPAGIPRAVRVRTDRERARSARVAVFPRHGVDRRGRCARGRRAGRRHRRLDDPRERAGPNGCCAYRLRGCCSI